MLKITKNQVVSGQKVVISNMDKKTTSFSDLGIAQSSFKKGGYKNGDILTLLSVSGTSVHFEDESGKKGSFWWSSFKNLTDLLGENKGIDNDEYVILHKGKRLNSKKFKDIGKLKASLLSAMGYHDLFEIESRKYLDNCPEHSSLETPYWVVGETFTKEEFSKFEIYKWNNRKLSDKVDFSPVSFYEDQLFYIKISSRYGSSARELFKKITDEHKYMFVFMHEEYNDKHCYYSSLKESNIIKSALSTLKLKNTTKSTKMGKTAIAVTSGADVIKIINSIPKDSKYLILDTNGDEIVKKESQFFIRDFRNERLDDLLINL